MLDEIILTDIVETHVHFRGGEMAEFVTGFTSYQCIAALPMPNVPRLNTVAKVLENTTALNRIIENSLHDCMIISCMMLDQIEILTTPDMIDDAVDHGIWDFKIYFVGTTTGTMGHNAAGIVDIVKLLPILKRIEARGGILHVHFELPAPHYFQWRERDSVHQLYWIVEQCPTLKVVAEHVSSARMVRAVLELPPHVTATITSHHLYDTLDAVNGGFLDPHSHCKPPHADPDNQTALQLAAISGNPKFRFGSDSAPHEQGKKECAEGCAGCFTAPIALLMLAEIFERSLPPELVQARRQPFVSDYSMAYHQITPRGKVVRIVREPYGAMGYRPGGDMPGPTVIPYRAGHEFKWRTEGPPVIQPRFSK